MSPLVAAPNRGYPDYQRVGNYDEGVIYSYSGPAVAPPFQSGILDVSRFAYLGGEINTDSTHMGLFLNWYADAAASVQAGVRSMQLSTSVGVPMQVRFPNLGPFVQLSFVRPEGGTVQPLLIVFGTNRVHPLELIPANAMLIDIQNQAIAGNVTTTVFPNDYYSGPVNVWCELNTGSQTVTMQTMNSNGVWDDFDQVVVTTSNQSRFVTVIPTGAWRVQVTNGSASAGTFFLAVTHPTTGAT